MNSETRRSLERKTNAFRVLARGELPGEDLAVDRYGDFLCAWTYDEVSPIAAILNRVRPHLDALARHYASAGLVLKRVRRNPHRVGLADDRVVIGETPPPVFTVHEHGCRYEIALAGPGHVGLFLDQRDNRERVFRAAARERVANLFAYTGSFSVVAAKGGAEVVFSVDSSAAALGIAKRNFDLNGLSSSGVGKFVREDVRAWIARELRKVEGGGAQLGLVICDPPTFSSTRDGGNFSIENEWPHLASDLARLLRPGGQALFSTNHRDGDASAYERALRKAFKSVRRLALPPDFPDIPGVPRLVSQFWCER